MRVLILHQEIPADAAPDERDVLQEAEAVGQSLVRLGHRAQVKACTLDLAALDATLEASQADVVFNLVESMAGTGRLIHLPPALLDARECAYTGNPAEAIFLTSHKILAKERLSAAGLPTPAWVMLPPDAAGRPRLQPVARDADGGRLTWLIKSVWEHASLGMDDTCFVRDAAPDDLAAPLAACAARMGGDCFAEEYVDGREFNVGLIAGPRGPEMLPPAEIVFTDFPADKPKIIGYQAKWETDSFEYQHTQRRFDFAPADGPLLERLRAAALACWEAFGLAGYARVDFRVDAAGAPWILEVNTNPCISPDAGFAAMLARAGISADQAIARLLDDAQGRARRFRHPDALPHKRAPTQMQARSVRHETGNRERTPSVFTFRYEVNDGDGARIRALTQATGFFHADEVEIAVELVDERLKKGAASGYEFVLAEQDGRLVGYTCFGPIPCTAASYDLYWIAVSPEMQGQGLGRQLQTETERRIGALGGTRLYAETSSRPQYLSTRAFYDRTGYTLAEMLPDFYAPGDGRATYLKVLAP